MFLICQNFYTLGVEEYITNSVYFTWRVSEREELVGGLTGDDGGGRLLRVGDSYEIL